MAQVHFLESTPPFYMDGLYYRVTPPAGHGEVELFVIDTTVLLAAERVLEAELHPDGREKATAEVEQPDPWSLPANEGERQMLAWLEQSLRSSTARWKLVVGHHPLWSTAGSKFEQARTLRALLLPSLCEYADAYFAGHEHTLEVHEDSCETVMDATSAKPLVQVVSGAAAKQRGVNEAFRSFQSATYPTNATLFAKGMIWGFAHIQLVEDVATVRLFSETDNGESPTLEFEYAFARRSKDARNKQP